MTRHEVEIRKLAETPLGGFRFVSFVRRWEMNNEPPPKEEKAEKYAACQMFPEFLSDVDNHLGPIHVSLAKVECLRLKRKTTSTRTMMRISSLRSLRRYSLEGSRHHHL